MHLRSGRFHTGIRVGSRAFLSDYRRTNVDEFGYPIGNLWPVYRVVRRTFRYSETIMFGWVG
jgi:hypothetical protein